MRENINLYKVFMRHQQVQLRLAFDLEKFFMDQTRPQVID